ncbi:ATP-dependent DNA helicase RRM3-like protein [Tanacetum coccineum]
MDLINKKHQKSTTFIDNIRRYNLMFAFTSMGGKQGKSVNTGRGPYCYRIQGMDCHRMGALLPDEGKPPIFSQLYIYDTENEIENIIKFASNGESTSSGKKKIDHQLTTEIRDMLDTNNPLRDGRKYNLPTAFEVVALNIGDFDSTEHKRDIILEEQGGDLQRISEFHPSYLALQYLSACEAAWRIYGFDIHYRIPLVERLPFHLPNEQSVIFDERDSLDYKLDKAPVNETNMSRPEFVYEKTWHVMATDVESIERVKKNDPELVLSDEQKKNFCLLYIEHMLLSNNKSLKSIPNMPYPTAEYTMDGYNRLVHDELSYNKDKLKEEHKRLYVTLTEEQKGIYGTIMDVVDKNKGGMFFVYGYGGTGKTYLYKTMSAACRSQGGIVLNVASSGIAALLLEGGRTAHSRFAIPINVVEDSMCNISTDSELAELLRMTKLIICD